MVAELGGAQHHVRIVDAAQRSQGEKSFIFEALFLAIESFEEALALDRASGAAMPAAEIIFRQRLSAQGVGVVKSRLLKIARGQSAETVKNRQIGDRADLSILVGKRAQTALAQRAGDRVDARRIGDRRWRDRRAERPLSDSSIP